MNSKIKSAAQLSRIIARLRSKCKRVVFTNGCFDILHVGHVDYLSKARQLGDILVVGLNSDRSVRALKGRGRPINKVSDRAKVLAALSFIDYVTVFDELTPGKLIQKIKPGILVKGGDWKLGDIVGADFVRSCGGKVITVPFVKGYSTTGLLKKMAKA